MSEILSNYGVLPQAGDSASGVGHPSAGARMTEGPRPGALLAGDSEWWRPLLGLTPHIPEGRATWDALVPERYKAKSLGEMDQPHRVETV